MSSTSFLKKSVPFRSFFRLSGSFLRTSNNFLQCSCATSSLKAPICNLRNQNAEKTDKTLTEPVKESDQFGTLEKQLEKDVKVNSSNQSRRKLIKIKRPPNNESDIFGNLSENKPFWYSDFNDESKIDNDLGDDSVILKTFGKRYRCPKVYLSEMKKLVKEKKIKDALNLFVEMRRQFVAPEHSHFTYMIGVCGRIGYTEMAFKLFRQMTDRALWPSPATLTGLFNACAESPLPEYGLRKAHSLKEKIEDKNFRLTQPTYHAMIKAFGKCGDLTTAFKIADEMAKADIKITEETYNFLLVSCISNKKAGFTYAVEVWRKMKAKKCKPTIYTFNLFLRAARDCDIGPEEIASLLLQHWSSYSKRPYGFITKEALLKEPVLKIKTGADSTSKPVESEQSCYQNLEDRKEKTLNEGESSYELQNTVDKSTSLQNRTTPTANLLSARPKNGPEIVEIVNIKTASDRLSLIGGVEGFFQSMDEAKVKPDIKTFCILLECLPDNVEAEENLISILDNYGVKPIVDFFNILIKKRNFRKETDAARKVLLYLNKYELAPDIMTFGALALGCNTFHKAFFFIDEMKKLGLSPNIEIIGSLARQSSMILDFPYMKLVLKLMEEENLKPDARLLRSLEKALSDARKNIILMEQGKEYDTFYERKNLKADLKEFSNFYEKWLKRMKFESEKHPWEQYKTEIIDRVKEENFVLSDN